MNTEAYFPKYKLKATLKDNYLAHMEALKVQFETDLDMAERCMNICKGKEEETCLKKCYTKFFDADLLCQKEMELYTVTSQQL